MGNGFNLSFIQKKGGFDQRLPIACGTGMRDLYAFRKFAVDVLDRTYGSSKRISFVVMVERIQECPVFADQSGFGGSGTGVDPKKCFSGIGFQVFDRDLVPCVPFFECMELCFCRKKRLHTVHFEIHLYAAVQLILHLAQRYLSVFL